MTPALRRRLGWLLLAALLALLWWRPLDEQAVRYTESGLQRAFITFATARALNATISVLQSATVNFQLGAGGSLQPGAILDPLDDLIEQFSTLMLAATLSFATQRLLIEMAGVLPVAIALSALLLMLAGWQTRPGGAPPWLARLTLGLVCLRFAVPVVALGSEASYALLLEAPYEQSQAVLANDALASAPADAPIDAQEGTLERFKRWWNEATDLRERIETLKQRTEQWVEHVVRLAAIFLVQTLVLPLLFLGAMLALYRGLSRGLRLSVGQRAA